MSSFLFSERMFNLTLMTLIVFSFTSKAYAQIEYGSNSQAGKYVESSGVKIYYEVYGEGPPLVMLHGALYGYIDEFSKHIPHLSKYFMVIAIGSRGHGKSALGREPFSYALLAKDVKAVLDNEKVTKASFFGFSIGANLARYFNAHYPEYVTKLVSMAGGVENKPEGIERIKKMSYASFEEDNKKFVDHRKSLMPEPERYPDVIENLKLLWLDKEFLKKDAFSSVGNAVLLIIGDRDDYYDVEQTVEVYRNTPKGRLYVVPNRNHVGLLFDENVLLNTVIPFLLEE